MEQKETLHIGLIGPLPPPFGGMANQTRQLKTLLESEGVKVTLVQTNAPYKPKFIGKFRGIRAFFRLILYIFKLWGLAGKVNLIQVLANSGWSWQLFSAPAVWIGWLRRTPVIINYRGGEAGSYFTKSFKSVRPTIKKASVVIVPSGFLKKVFSEFGLSADIIPNIIDMERFRPKGVAAMRTITAPHLIVTRNLESIYDIPTAINAVAILHKSVPNVKLSLAGSGPQKSELHNLVRQLDLEDVVKFTGKLGPDEVAALYQRADVMLNPTTVDNMPNSVLESLACGVPVVTTNVGGIPYIVEDEKNALMVEPGDAEGMARQVKRLLEDSTLYLNLVNNGLAEVTKYTWPEIRDKWMSLYRRLQTVR